MPEFLHNQDFASEVEDCLEMAIEKSDWEEAEAYSQLRDWLHYDKDISWLPILETI